MKALLAIGCGLIVGASLLSGADDFIDRLDAALTWTAQHDEARARLSGALELEGYRFDYPAPGLIRSEKDSLLNPRLTLFLDAQLGSKFYFFAQSRVDRGFDPGEGGGQLRLDEYALRFSPRSDGRINFQVGKFATVVGNWVARHQAWDNPFITAPMPYENPTGIHNAAAAGSLLTLLNWSHVAPLHPGTEEDFDQYRVPIVWGPSYASGAAVSSVIGRADYAFEFKNSSLSAHPDDWDATRVQWQQPTISGRLGYRPNESWYLGFSGSTGSYLDASARTTLAPGRSAADYREEVWAQDIAFAWHHVQVWAEIYEASFRIPLVGRAGTVAYYVETKYKFTPQFSGAVRWNQQVYNDLPDGSGGSVQWARNAWRIDFAPSYRFTPHTELKLQYSLQQGGFGSRNYSRLLATQLVLRF